jgi:cytochrome c oxidase subunit 2
MPAGGAGRLVVPDIGGQNSTFFIQDVAGARSARRVKYAMLKKLCASVAGVLIAIPAFADWTLNMPEGVTDLSAETYRLHMMVFWWCVAIAVVTFGAMIIALVKHRKSLGVKPAKFSHSMKAEVTWTVIPIIILLVMAVPAAETVIKLEDTRDPDLTVVATGYQWKWHYRYQGEDVEFFSNLDRESANARRVGSGVDPFTVDNYLLEVDNRLVVPKGKKVRLLLTSNDVLHAWWVPELAIKKDAIPGYVNETFFRANETGVYRGQCAELCGMDHGFMPVVVEVVEPEEYQAWLDVRQENGTKMAAGDD